MEAVVERSNVARATAYKEGVERLVSAVEAAAQGEDEWKAGLSAGLGAGLDLLAADPTLARLLLVEAPAAGPIRLEHERSLVRLAEALRPPVGHPIAAGVVAETARLIAGGLVSHLSGRVLAGEAERLGEDRNLLLEYLLAPSLAADARVAAAI